MSLTPLTPLSLLAAFGAGIASFLAPCVLPLVPGYLSFLAGTSLQEIPDQPTTRWRVGRHALWFVAGCTVIFMLLGASAALLGSALSAYQAVLERVGGLLLILFGLALTGLVPLPWEAVRHRPERSEEGMEATRDLLRSPMERRRCAISATRRLWPDPCAILSGTRLCTRLTVNLWS